MLFLSQIDMRLHMIHVKFNNIHVYVCNVKHIKFRKVFYVNNST